MTQSPELPWIAEARRHLGQREIPGNRHNPFIVGIWAAIGVSWFKDDETPWCAGFVAYCLKRADFEILGPAKVGRALAWADYGKKLDKPAYGCLAIKSRNGGGHVGFVVGRNQMGQLMVLGGNQDNSVSIAPYNDLVFQSFRWPSIWPAEQRWKLPVLQSNGKPVMSEA